MLNFTCYISHINISISLKLYKYRLCNASFIKFELYKQYDLVQIQDYIMLVELPSLLIPMIYKIRIEVFPGRVKRRQYFKWDPKRKVIHYKIDTPTPCATLRFKRHDDDRKRYLVAWSHRETSGQGKAQEIPISPISSYFHFFFKFEITF